MGGSSIDDLLYHYNQTHYTKLAEHVKKMCEKKLKERKIQALVTCRCKEEASLRNKLESMNRRRLERNEKSFESMKEVEQKVKDLAGVRIALYVPQQKAEVMAEINRLFQVDEWKKGGKAKDEYFCKTCGEVKLKKAECDSCRSKSKKSEVKDDEGPDALETDDIYEPVFAGYVADHARVKLKTKKAPEDLKDWKPDHVVEIQIVSVLLHAWAEVEHDVVYKTIRAKANLEEMIILDSLNGFIRSSEMLLDQLHTMISNRIENSTKPFANKFALAAFLDGYLRGILSDDKKNNLELKMLFGLLKVVRKDSQQQLEPILRGLGFGENNNPDDVRALQERLKKRYSVLEGAHNTFLLAPQMRIPFYIMEGILVGLDKEDERDAQERARAEYNAEQRLRAGDSAERKNDEHRSYQCRVLLSSFLWLGQLYIGGSPSGAIDTIDFVNEEEKKAFAWPLTSPKRFDILVQGRKARSVDESAMDTLWRWFENQKEPYFSFAFRISRLGVTGSFPDDLAPLRKGNSDSG
ncbi:hypothetical protein K458DRAFT_288500 [Lentithecium fluviatile CBS 122367]|uniref:RelA/SpoT domain-containing protein n=1 Tax=Lentithecium fluviatile CBS 122367 TaxID=1168545 RepID=A0A6G1JL78_9PLEO|nr:hypothetical protein K458DRAFT_288500 [Lentithecium fluviatile CBS 122367]